MQQGGSPTPFDRNMGTKQGARSVEWLVETCKKNPHPTKKVYTKSPDSAVLMGIMRRQYSFSPLAELKQDTNFELV